MKLKKSSPLKLLSQSEPNFAEMILRWSPFKIVSVSAVLYPGWSPLLKIDISSNGQNCSIWSQKVPKFELYRHNDELFNIYYGIFYELWTFDRLCKLEKRGDEIKKNLLLWNYWANLNQTLLKWSLGSPLSNLCPSALKSDLSLAPLYWYVNQIISLTCSPLLICLKSFLSLASLYWYI